MSREGNLMRGALKRQVVPALRGMGFAGTGTSFRRLLPARQDLLTIQFSKYGGSFILEFGSRERGPLQTSWGPVVPEDEVSAIYLSVTQRARLQEAEAQAKDAFAGFSFEGFGDSELLYESLAIRVCGLLSQAEGWLCSRTKGPNVHAFSEA
jgi:hypothetical protein